MSNDKNLLAAPLSIAGLALLALLFTAAPAWAAPTATTNPAAPIHHTDAVLHGHLDPSGDPGFTECYFEWGTDTSYGGDRVPCDQATPISSPTDVTATLANLTPEVVYHYRVTGETTSNGAIHGGDQTVETPPFELLHSQVASIGPDGTANSSFDGNRFGPLAFRQSTAGLFALNGNVNEPGAIYGFNAANPLSSSPLGAPFPLPASPVGNIQALAIDPSTGNLYYSIEMGSTLQVAGLSPSGASLSGFPIEPEVNPGGAPGTNKGLAVDSSGHLWVAYGGDSHRILEYGTDGAYLGAVDVSAQIPIDSSGSGVGAIAFDSNDDLYVGSFAASNPPDPDEGVWRYTASSGYADASKIYNRSVDAIALDPVDHRVFLSPRQALEDNEGNLAREVREYGPGGGSLGAFARTSDAEIAGLAVDGSNHYVYVGIPHYFGSDLWSSTIHVFDPGVVQRLPTVTPQPPADILDHSATLHAKVDPEGVQVLDCHFSYVDDAAYQVNRYAQATDVPCSPNPGSGSGDVDVSAAPSDLNGGTVYHFRIVAASADGPTKGPEQTLTTLGPQIHSSSPHWNSFTTTAAAVDAAIDPEGENTSWQVEYVSKAEFDSHGFNGAQSTAPQAIGKGGTDVSVSTQISGLTPGTAYVARVLAENPSGTSYGPGLRFSTFPDYGEFGACPNAEFRTGPSAGLPDCRAYEQATSPEKGGADIHVNFQQSQASLSGDAITFENSTAMPGAVGADYATNGYVAQRGASGWSVHGLLPPPTIGGANAYVYGWTSDLKLGFVTSISIGEDQYLSELGQDLSNYSFERYTQPIASTAAEKEGGDIAFVGASADDSKIFIETKSIEPAVSSGPPPAPSTGGSRQNLFLFDRDTGQLALVGVLPNSEGGGAPPGGSIGGPYEWASVSGDAPYHFLTGGIVGRYVTGAPINVVSDSGDRAFFTAGQTAQLYARQGLLGANPETVRLSASLRTVPDPNGQKPDVFLQATPDGSQAFFLSCQKLTDDSTAVSDGSFDCSQASQGRDLYRWQAAGSGACDAGAANYGAANGGCLTDLSPDGADPIGAQVQGVLGTSRNGDYVYFAANGKLASNQGADGSHATPGDCRLATSVGQSTGVCNIYLWHAGTISYVAPLDFGANDEANIIPDPDNTSSPGRTEHTAFVSSNGTVLVFRSANPLTGRENDVSPQYFRFQSESGDLACITCSPTGAPSSPHLFSVEGSGVTMGRFWQRSLSSDGQRFFFETTDKLVPADVNGDTSCPRLRRHENESAGVSACQDVYEWEADGVGDCRTAPGCFYLISSGTAPEPSFLADASSSGNDVFFATRDQLVPQDSDHLRDVYDARVGGGLSAQYATSPPPCGDPAQCRGTATSPSTVPGAGSAVFVGPGNPPRTSHCAKGKVRRRGHCVRRRHRPRRKHHKRKHQHHRRKHHGLKHHKRRSQKRAAHHDRRANR